MHIHTQLIVIKLGTRNKSFTIKNRTVRTITDKTTINRDIHLQILSGNFLHMDVSEDRDSAIF